MSDEGGYRRDDPSTSKQAARAIKASKTARKILDVLSRMKHPLNGWELSYHLSLPTITVVPRLAPMRRNGWITQEGKRPGPPPKRLDQLAYVISDGGRLVLQGLPVPPSTSAPAQEELPLTRAWFADAKDKLE